MSEFMSYDQWSNIITRNGIPGDEVISALQKSIRRNLPDKAVRFAYEMYITSMEFEEKLWRRLQIISIEDIGFGDIQAPMYINTLNQMRKSFPYNDGDRPLFFIHAIRYLCACPKERSSDHLKNIIMKEFDMGVIPEVPDFALDCHTVRGRAMGRDVAHFLREASVVTPEMENATQEYKVVLDKMLKDELDGKAEYNSPNKFQYSVSQA